MVSIDILAMTVIGPAMLGIVLLWLATRKRPSRGSAAYRRTEQGTRELYAEEERRRLGGADEL
jgi:ABC-type phosphonate transport system ATPase subunit